jgi:hypothetical protein
MAEVSFGSFRRGEDLVITKGAIEKALNGKTQKRSLYSTNEVLKSQGNIRIPTRLIWRRAGFIRECGIQHLLIDLPSVDKEKTKESC